MPPTRRRRRKPSGWNVVLLVLIAVFLVLTGLLIKLCIGLASKPAGKPAASSGTSPTVITEPQPAYNKVVASAAIGTQGDLLMHKPVIQACKTEDGYDFSAVFRYTKAYTQPLDYAIANLETTFAGSAYPYQGYPAHNCPDALADAAREAGFDMLLTANNHCNDTLADGMNRTLEQVRQRGMEALGSRLSDSEKRYSIVDVNGIRIGMVCYTYAMGIDNKGVCMNGANTYLKNPAQLNYFTDNKLDQLYTEIQSIYAEMASEGAEATVLFIHWGEEYKLTPNDVQRSIAQKMCDIGFDLIVGGHPHVVQPIALLTSNQDPEHKTVCIYSLGNAISNQFIDQMTNQKDGYTEDGVLFTASFEKYADGTVTLGSVDALPTWIVRIPAGDRTDYCMVPLEDARRSSWQSLYSLSDSQAAAAAESYSRTMNLLGSGLSEANGYLAQVKEALEAKPLN